MTDGASFIEIKVTQPEKIGDGMTAYIRYSIKTETNLPELHGTSFEVHRRFREFHALYETLVDIYRDKGIHIPHPPEKSISTSAKVKAVNKDPNELTQIEIRRRALETFINRIARHPVLMKDQIVVEFITSLVSTVKARDSMIKFRMNLKQSFTFKLTGMDAYDKWFEEKVNQITNLDQNLQKLYYIALDVHSCRKDIIYIYQRFASSLNELRASEQNDTISAAFGGLADLKEAMADVHLQLCNNDLAEIIGTTKDYTDDLISVQHLLDAYTRKFSEAKALSNKIDKLKEKQSNADKLGHQAESNLTLKEIEELVKLHTFNVNSMEEFYEQMKTSIEYFENNRAKDTRESFIRYIKKTKDCQQEMLTLWEKLLPVCQSIK